MIIPPSVEQYDDSVLFAVFETDKDGNSVQKEDKPPIATKQNCGQLMYQTRYDELLILKNQVIDGKISPLKLYMTNQMLVEADVAQRVKLPLGKVKKHMTFNGFKKATVDELQRYANVFGVTVSEFFTIIYPNGRVKAEMKNYHNRLLHEVKYL